MHAKADPINVLDGNCLSGDEINNTILEYQQGGGGGTRAMMLVSGVVGNLKRGEMSLMSRIISYSACYGTYRHDYDESQRSGIILWRYEIQDTILCK